MSFMVADSMTWFYILVLYSPKTNIYVWTSVLTQLSYDAMMRIFFFALSCNYYFRPARWL